MSGWHRFLNRCGAAARGTRDPRLNSPSAESIEPDSCAFGTQVQELGPPKEQLRPLTQPARARCLLGRSTNAIKVGKELGIVLSTQRGSRILTPGTFNPTSDRLIA